MKKLFLKVSQYLLENYLCWDFFLIKMFSYEYCEIFKKTYFEEHLQTAASTSIMMQ